LGIGDREEEEVKGEGVGTATGREPAAEETLIAPTEAFGNLAEPLGPEEDFVIIHEGIGKALAPRRRISRPLAATRSR
jgi:hypothetical protein